MLKLFRYILELSLPQHNAARSESLALHYEICTFSGIKMSKEYFDIFAAAAVYHFSVFRRAVTLIRIIYIIYIYIYIYIIHEAIAACTVFCPT